MVDKTHIWLKAVEQPLGWNKFIEYFKHKKYLLI